MFWLSGCYALVILKSVDIQYINYVFMYVMYIMYVFWLCMHFILAEVLYVCLNKGALLLFFDFDLN